MLVKLFLLFVILCDWLYFVDVFVFEFRDEFIEVVGVSFDIDRFENGFDVGSGGGGFVIEGEEEVSGEVFYFGCFVVIW